MRSILVHIFAILLFCALNVTAADYHRTSDGMSFSWQEHDYVGVYTSNGSLLKYYANGGGSNTASFSCGFGLTENTEFYAYSPYDKNNWDKEVTAIPARYLDQVQKGNGNTMHLSAYDYQMTKFTTGAEAAASATFSHIGAILHISWALTDYAKHYQLSALTLNASSSSFVTVAAMNLSSQSVATDTTSHTVTLGFEDTALTAGDTLDAYIMVFPVDMTGDTITASLATVAGDTLLARVCGTEVLAGHMYPIAIGAKDVMIPAKARDVMVRPSLTSAASISGYSPDFVIDEEHTFTVVPKYKKGDVNMDGWVNISDVNAVISVMCGDKTYQETGDVNDDGAINISDVNAVISIMCGAIK